VKSEAAVVSKTGFFNFILTSYSQAFHLQVISKSSFGICVQALSFTSKYGYTLSSSNFR